LFPRQGRGKLVRLLDRARVVAQRLKQQMMILPLRRRDREEQPWLAKRDVRQEARRAMRRLVVEGAKRGMRSQKLGIAVGETARDCLEGSLYSN
jgi:hypothetical protein